MTIAAKPAFRVLVLLPVALTIFALAVVGGYYGFLRRYNGPPTPPEIDLTDADKPVADAIQKALAAVHEKPRSAETWGKLGQVLRAHAFFEEANICFAQAERFDANDPRWPYLQGLYLRTREPDVALPHIERAVQCCEAHAPDKTAPRLVLAEMLLDKGRIAEAEDQLHKVLKIEPRNELANYDLGMAALARDDLPGCLRCLTPLTANPYTRQKANSQLAMIYLRQNDEETAARFTRQTRDAPPDLTWPDPYVAEVEALDVSRLARYRQAQELEEDKADFGVRFNVLSKLVEDFPDSKSRGAAGMMLVNAHKYKAAEVILREAVSEAPETIQAHYLLSVALLHEAKYREAADVAGRAIELKPDHGLAHAVRGYALRRLGERTEALAALRRAVLCRPELADAHEELGETLAESGLNAEALAELQTALQLGITEPKLADKAREQYVQVLLRAFLPVFP